VKICKHFYWDAAHFLELPYASKCANLHGHTYHIEVEVEGPINDDGMVFDFSRFTSLMAPANFDHQSLNGLEWFKDKNPTAENIVHYIYHFITQTWVYPNAHVSRIRVWETPNSWAEDTWTE
jgi:6-pyruvoyltetrahydropterin/6-carboxytetrahydropterin synthase